MRGRKIIPSSDLDNGNQQGAQHHNGAITERRSLGSKMIGFYLRTFRLMKTKKLAPLLLFMLMSLSVLHHNHHGCFF